MSLDELKRLIQTAQWFANLGAAISAPKLVWMTEPAWRRLTVAAMCAEFGLPYDPSIFDELPFAEMERLPTGNDEPDPIHGDSLDTAARELGREVEFKAARLDAFRSALASQRAFPDRPILKVGATDSNEAARSAGRFACRMAASEIVVGQVGFWCEMVKLFHEGRWPLWRLPCGEVVVL